MPSLAKHNYVSCLMQITLPEIDNYTLYYETFACLFSAFTLLCSLTTFTGIHNHPLAQFVRSRIITNLPMSDMQSVEKKGKETKTVSTSARVYILAHLSEYHKRLLQHHYSEEKPSWYCTRPESNQKLIRARARSWLQLTKKL